MQLTRAADYGIRAMVHLAGLPTDSRCSVSELARITEVPDAFLTKVMRRLAAAGLIVSHRGPTGGFQLNVAPASISLLQVVEAIEGPIQLNLCTGACTGAPTCTRESWCPVHVVWQHAQAKLRETLGAACLQALAHESSQRMLSVRTISPNGA